MFQVSRLYCRRRSYQYCCYVCRYYLGTILSASISMLIYMKQGKSTEEQDKILKHIEELGIK